MGYAARMESGGNGTTLILDIGNLLMGDEGVGVHVARALDDLGDRPDVDVVDGGTGGFHLLEYFERYGRLILVDAALDPHVPAGAILTPEEIEAFRGG